MGRTIYFDEKLRYLEGYGLNKKALSYKGKLIAMIYHDGKNWSAHPVDGVTGIPIGIRKTMKDAMNYFQDAYRKLYIDGEKGDV